MHQNILIGLLITISLSSQAKEITFISSDQQTLMIELYTSEGCSSCPPADQFISQFKSSDQLWQTYIPVAFHVDYWDYLGWQDRFANAAYSQRQRNYKSQGHLNSVYTPGFVVNGEEWTGFFKPWRSFPDIEAKPGKLALHINQPAATMIFESSSQALNFHLAVVGLGLTTEVMAGENAGEALQHDFVVLHHQQQQSTSSATMPLPMIVKHQPEQFAVVAWVTHTDSLQPIQAVGGTLPRGLINQLK